MSALRLFLEARSLLPWNSSLKVQETVSDTCPMVETKMGLGAHHSTMWEEIIVNIIAVSLLPKYIRTCDSLVSITR